MKLRAEEERDARALRAVHEAAFGGSEEADLVEALHAAGSVEIALLAELEGRVVAHVLLSRVNAGPTPVGPQGLALAPMAVLPEHQDAGIGSSLVRAGLEAARAAGHAWVVVLGHPSYYPRFGFVPASRFGLTCRWKVPDDTYLALELWPGALEGVSGEVRYAAAFDAL